MIKKYVIKTSPIGNPVGQNIVETQIFKHFWQSFAYEFYQRRLWRVSKVWLCFTL